MSMTRVTAGNEASIDDLNQIIDLLQGTSGFTEAFLLRCATSSDFKVRLSDASGARRFEIQDSAGVAQAYVDSDGNLTILGALSIGGGLVLPTSTSPSQTTEGSAAWDSDDDLLKIGTGSGTKVIGLSRGAGLSASATQELAYDTTAAQLNVWNGSSSVSAAASFFDSKRTAFRANRRVIAQWAGTAYSGGFGFISTTGPATGSATNISGEPIVQATGTGTSRMRGGGVALLAPTKSPRMLLRIQFPAASANVTFCEVGFFDTPHASTADGAYLRVVTTGNVFFVTQNGASETATDLGALSRTTILGFEIETADAGVTWVCRNQAGTVLATHTTNVPTAATGLDYGFESSIATAGVNHGIVSMTVEATTA